MRKKNWNKLKVQFGNQIIDPLLFSLNLISSSLFHFSFFFFCVGGGGWCGGWGVATLFLTFSCLSKRTHDYKSISFNQKWNTDCPTKWTYRLNLLLFDEFTPPFQLNDKRLVFKTEKYLDTFLDSVNSRWPFWNSTAMFDHLSLSLFF